MWLKLCSINWPPTVQIKLLLHGALLVQPHPDQQAWNMTDAGWTWETALSIYKQLEDWDGPPAPW